MRCAVGVPGRRVGLAHWGGRVLTGGCGNTAAVELGPPRRSIRREAACGSTYTRSEHTIPSSTGDPTRAEPGH